MKNLQKEIITVTELRRALAHARAIVFENRSVVRGDETAYTTDKVFVLEEHDDATAEALRKEIENLRGLVFRDQLTGVLNRRGLLDEFEGFFKETLFQKKNPNSARHAATFRDISIIFLDIDDFKSINDTYGHDVGDHVLRSVGGVLGKGMRDIDGVGRFGGEEFVVIMLDATEDQAFEKAEELRKEINKNVSVPEDASRKITASFGVASLQKQHSDTLEALIKSADEAMYEAKHGRGKNNTVRASEMKQNNGS